MQFWEGGVVLTILLLAGLLVAGEALRAAVPLLRTLGLPASILAGVLGLIAGPSVLGLLPTDADTLEAIVYHGLALVFIAVSLQPPEEGEGRRGALSIAFAVPAMMSMQMVLGLGIVLALGFALGSPVHPGFGLILPMGFEEGPGQALSLGHAWEQGGMTDGAQFGLIVAALGFAWAVGAGIPMVAIGVRKGLVAKREAEEADERAIAMPRLPAGAVDLLTRQVAAIGVCYLVTWAIVAGVAAALGSMPEVAAMIWGVHFIVGAGVGLGARALLERFSSPSPLHPELLGRLGGLTVDFVTVAALSAVQLAVLGDNWLLITLVTGLGGAATLLLSIWLAKRAFRDEPFEHCIVLFGMSTGTLPMGLALLRIVDPDLRGPAPLSAVLGSAGAVLGAIPILLVLMPIPIVAWPDGYPGAGFTTLGLTAAYGVAVMLAWWWSGALKPGSPWPLWPADTD